MTTDKSQRICNPLAQPLVDHKDLIDWYKTKYEQIQAQITSAREKYAEADKQHVQCQDHKLHFESIPLAEPLNENLKSMETYNTKHPLDERNYTYEELVNMMDKARRRSKPPDCNIMDRLKQKARDKAADKEFKAKMETMLLHELWQNFLGKQEEEFDKLIAKKTLKQSGYEKQMATKCLEIKAQKESMMENRRIVENLIAKKREDEFLRVLAGHQEKMGEDEDRYEFERARMIQLHCKLYRIKLMKRRQKTQNCCYKIVEDLVSLALRYAEHKKFYEEEAPKHLARNWTTLFLSELPLFDVIEKVESVLLEIPGKNPLIPYDSLIISIYFGGMNGDGICFKKRQRNGHEEWTV